MDTLILYAQRLLGGNVSPFPRVRFPWEHFIGTLCIYFVRFLVEVLMKLLSLYLCVDGIRMITPKGSGNIWDAAGRFHFVLSSFTEEDLFL